MPLACSTLGSVSRRRENLPSVHIVMKPHSWFNPQALHASSNVSKASLKFKHFSMPPGGHPREYGTYTGSFFGSQVPFGFFGQAFGVSFTDQELFLHVAVMPGLVGPDKH